MPQPESSRRQLTAIAEVQTVASELNVDVWLRGGWAMDFYLGRVTRDHADVDWFVWATDLSTLADALIANGWTDLAEHPAGQQSDLVKGDVEMGLAPLAKALDGQVVVGGGPWAGELWPERMLDDALEARLGGISCPVISPRAQVEIKRMMPIWVPGRPRRPKDAEDIAHLVNALGAASQQ